MIPHADSAGEMNLSSSLGRWTFSLITPIVLLTTLHIQRFFRVTQTALNLTAVMAQLPHGVAESLIYPR